MTKLLGINNVDLNQLYDIDNLLNYFPDVIESTHPVRERKVYQAASANPKCDKFFILNDHISPYLVVKGWIIYSYPCVFSIKDSQTTLRSHNISETLIEKILACPTVKQ